ncbi:MAG: hypothetical protein JNL68_15990 [Burkholderiales bacterium]|nr:hypothetical protein [Burkholderiales bacterium]
MALLVPKGSEEFERLTLRCWAMAHWLASLRIDRLVESGSDGNSWSWRMTCLIE